MVGADGRQGVVAFCTPADVGRGFDPRKIRTVLHFWITTDSCSCSPGIESHGIWISRRNGKLRLSSFNYSTSLSFLCPCSRRPMASCKCQTSRDKYHTSMCTHVFQGVAATAPTSVCSHMKSPSSVQTASHGSALPPRRHGGVDNVDV